MKQQIDINQAYKYFDYCNYGLIIKPFIYLKKMNLYVYLQLSF